MAAAHYVDFVVHIFSESARKFYDLERLWKTATRLELSDLEKPAPKPKKAVSAKRVGVKKTAAKKKSPTPSTSTGQALSQKRGKGGAPTSKRTRKDK